MAKTCKKMIEWPAWVMYFIECPASGYCMMHFHTFKCDCLRTLDKLFTHVDCVSKQYNLVLAVARKVTAGLVESRGNQSPVLWIMSPAAWLPRDWDQLQPYVWDYCYHFIARQCADIAILSVCPYVRDMLVLYENGLTYRHSFFTIR